MRFSMAAAGGRKKLWRSCAVWRCRRVRTGGELCRRFHVQPRILYKWLERYRQEGLRGCRTVRAGRVVRHAERSLSWKRRCWRFGGRTRCGAAARSFSATLVRARCQAALAFDHHRDPAPQRGPLVAPGQKAWKRFEHAEPNVLWQMDFKGEVAMRRGQLHPLTIVDDHSRYSVGLQAADNQRHETVQDALQAAFECYGLPLLMLTDNGSPWGDTGEGADQARRMVDRAWRGAIAQRAVSSAEPWQERALQPHAQGRAAQWSHLRRSPRCPACLRCLAAPLQSSSPARRLEPCGAGRSLSLQPAFVQRQGRAVRVRARRHCAPGRRGRLAQLRRKTHEGFQGADRQAGRDQANRARRTFDLVFRHVTVKSIDFHKQA